MMDRTITSEVARLAATELARLHKRQHGMPERETLDRIDFSSITTVGELEEAFNKAENLSLALREYRDA